MNEVCTLTKEELVALMDSEHPPQIINVLGPEYHYLGSIKGSRHLPLSELKDRMGELDRSREIVTYCSSYDCNASKNAAKILEEAGFAVRAYEGGIHEWKAAGLPTEMGKAAA